jgi:hypothetical protein
VQYVAGNVHPTRITESDCDINQPMLVKKWMSGIISHWSGKHADADDIADVISSTILCFLNIKGFSVAPKDGKI